MSAPLRIGIAGYGSIGRVHHQALLRCSDADVVAAAPARAARDGDPSLEWYADAAELIERADVDVVSVCTPSGGHADVALRALEAGKHVVVEKPLALDLDMGRRVVEAARRAGRLLSVVSQRRFEPQNVALAQLVRSGELGAPVLGEALVRWYREQAYYDSAPWRGTIANDGGVLMNQAIHVVDLLRWLLGPVVEVSAATATLTHEMEAEDTAVATLRFASGALGSITATTSAYPGLPAELNLFFERGSVAIADDRIVRWDVPAPRPEAAADAGSGAADPAAITTVGHTRQWEDILAAVRAGRDPLVTGEEGLATVEIVLAAYESSRTGRAVALAS